MSETPADLSVREAGRRLRTGQLTAVALVDAVLERIAAEDGALASFVTVTPEHARARAREADADFAAGIDRGPLQGIPYGLKDIYDTAGIRTTCHSKLFEHHVPERSSVCAEKLDEAGGVLVGKLATHEFAFGGPSFDLPFPPARNPWNLEHMPGGSSSGSGAAVAAGFLRVAMGSDTGGSIRGPAAFCGVAGLKATYGRVSRRGVFPLSYTLDHCGPLARTVEDAAVALQAVAGYDPADPASADVPVDDYLAGLDDGVQGVRIGLVSNFYEGPDAATPEIVAAIEAMAARLRDAGAVVEPVELPDFELFNACGRLILLSEAFAIHETDLQSRPQDYARLTMERIAIGGYIRSADYIQALRLRRELATAVNGDVLQRHDALLAPAALGTAPRFADLPKVGLPHRWPMRTMAFNVTGNPALSVCTGFAADGLPLSMQIVGRPFDEAMVLRIGHAAERSLGLENRRAVPAATVAA
jgi:aspartyl-tRNA(Asn)/glutamyl-tRNA(Gln) amidotransferase subunit A